MAPPVAIDIEHMRRVSARTGEYAGACPLCKQAAENGFRVWIKPNGSRPANRYWCRKCDARGRVVLNGAQSTTNQNDSTNQRSIAFGNPQPDHITSYRRIYEIVTTWASRHILVAWNPEPAAYVRKRGLDIQAIKQFRVGYSLRNPTDLPKYLAGLDPTYPHLAHEAGLLITIDGAYRTHRNFCGALLFPVIAAGEVIDLRARQPIAGAHARALTGKPQARGAVYPQGWDTSHDAPTVIITEGPEFKSLVPIVAYQQGKLAYPTLGYPGLTTLRTDDAERLARRGVRHAVVIYDHHQPRSGEDPNLSAEQFWAITNGLRLEHAGITTSVVTLPISSGIPKIDLDAFLLIHGPEQLSRCINDAPSLHTVIEGVPNKLKKDSWLTYKKTSKESSLQNGVSACDML